MTPALRHGVGVSHTAGCVLLGVGNDALLLTPQEARDIAYALDMAAERAHADGLLEQMERVVIVKEHTVTGEAGPDV